MQSPIFYKPKLWKRLLWILLIVVIAVGLLFLANFLFAKYLPGRIAKAPVNDQPNTTPISFALDPRVTYANASGNSKLFFYSAENVKITDKSGKLLKDLTLKLSQPKISLCGESALFYDVGGRRVVSFLGEKQICELSLETNIILCSINANGYMLIVTEGDLHKCAVSVYSPDGKEMFKWNSGGLSVVAADIADNNKDITVSTINTDGAVIKSNLIMFNIAKEKPFTNDTYEGDIFSQIHYSGSHIYCVGGSSTKIYNHYGKCVASADYSNRELTHVKTNEDLLVLAFSGSSSNTGVAEIKTYNAKGEETGSFSTEQEINFLDVKDGSIAVNTGRTISILSSHCRERFRINPGFDLRDFSFIGDSRHGIGITATGAEIIELGA